MSSSSAQPPAGLRLTRGPSPGAFTLRRRWARPKHVLFLAASAAIVAFLVPAWVRVSEGAAVATPLLVAGSIFGLGVVLRVLTVVISWTKVTVGEREVLVEHGPLPSPVFRPVRVARDAVRDFEARPWHGKHEVVAVDAQGTRTSLVHMLVTPAQADYVRDALRKAWALPDGDVPPEAEGAATDAVRTGGRGIAVMPFVLVLAVFALFFFMTSSEVEGSVRTSTNVNDVWALRGSARAQCEGLTMDVRFDGCH